MELKTTLPTLFQVEYIEAQHTLSLQGEKEAERHGKEPDPI